MPNLFIVFYGNWSWKLSSVSGERRAESREWRAENSNFCNEFQQKECLLSWNLELIEAKFVLNVPQYRGFSKNMCQDLLKGTPIPWDSYI